MTDPFSITVGTVTLLSLGIQVTQSIADFYRSYEKQDKTVARAVSNLKSLRTTFESLENVLRSRKFVQERIFLENTGHSIESCRELVDELREVYGKLCKSADETIKARFNRFCTQLAYPIRRRTLRGLDEAIIEIRDNLSFALEVLGLQDQSRSKNDVEEIKSLLDLLHASQISADLRKWLNAPDVSANYSDASDKRHPGTGMWFVQSRTFANWLKNDNSFLWLNDFAGCGKTVLSSTIIQHTFQHRNSNPSIGIVFFFFKFDDSSKQTLSDLLRALLLQLSKQAGDNFRDIVQLKGAHENTPPSTSTLLKRFTLMAQKFAHVYVILDALDESPRTGRRHVLTAIKDLRSSSLQGLHLLVTSRDTMDIRQSLKAKKTEDIKLNNESVRSDIKNYIEGQLEQNETLQEWSAYHAIIKDKLTARAGGM